MTTDLSPISSPSDRFPSDRDLHRLLPSWLDGSEGTNRLVALGTVKQIAANTDLDAILAWLKVKAESSPHTIRSYRREAFRLMLWSTSIKDKPVSSLTVEDIADFDAWLADPALHPAWEDHGWEVIRGPLSTSSRLQAKRILLGMFGWLCEAGYLAGNPFKIYDAGKTSRTTRAIAESKQRRFLPHELWLWLQGHMDELRPDQPHGRAFLAYERQRFVVNFLYWSGLRRFELAQARMADIRADGDQWVLLVAGKGRIAATADEVALLPPAMEAIRRYRKARGLSEYPAPYEKDVPLVAANGGAAITDNYLNRLLKAFLQRAAPAAAAENPGWEGPLRDASAHWMRHTMATHYAEAGVPIQTTADQLRHKTIDTTRRIYTHVEAKHRRAALTRILEYSKDPKK